MISRCVLLLSVVALTYLGVNEMGPVGWYVQDALTPPPSNNGYSGYTMYERCHIDALGIMHDNYTHQEGC